MGMTRAPSRRRAFTLVELLVVIGIVALLVAMLVPALMKARESTRKVACLSNLHHIGVAIQAYAHGNGNRIPFGPKAPPALTATNFYPVTGAPTSLISLMNGDPVGLGLLLRRHLSQQATAIFCPGSDQPTDAYAELAKVGRRQAQCSYYYRHGSVTRWYDASRSADPPAPNITLDNLGRNRRGRPIRALVIDTQFPAPPGLAAFGIVPRTHHRQRSTGILFAQGHALSRPNTDGRFTVRLDDYDALMNAFDRILAALENADAEQ